MCATCVDGSAVEGETYSIEIQAFGGYFDLDPNPHRHLERILKFLDGT